MPTNVVDVTTLPVATWAHRTGHGHIQPDHNALRRSRPRARNVRVRQGALPKPLTSISSNSASRHETAKPAIPASTAHKAFWTP
jgi:hypothetical protein